MHCALCIMLCALCIVHCALCIMLCALCFVHYALCIVHYALCIMHCALCIVHYALCIMHCALCIVHYALCIMHYALLKFFAFSFEPLSFFLIEVGSESFEYHCVVVIDLFHFLCGEHAHVD